MPEPPRVLFAIGGLGRGGSERQLMQLLESAHPGRLQATVLTLSTACDPGFATTLRELGIELIQLPPTQGPRMARPAISIPRVFRATRRVRPDAIYAWLEEAATLTAPIARALRVPLLVARRNVCGARVEANPLFRVPIRLAERQAAIVTGNSLAVIEEAAARGVAADRLRLVPNGHPPVDPLPPRTSETVVLGYLANYRPEKGHERFLAALQLVETTTPWRADFAGSGELRVEIEKSIAARGLSGHVTAGGQVTDVRAFWEDRDVAVLLSDDEGSPNVLIEAAMLGRPLVGTAAGGTKEVIPSEAGVLVDHDPTAIATALTNLIEDRELRRVLGTGARRHAAEYHDLDRSVDGHLRSIAEAIVPA